MRNKLAEGGAWACIKPIPNRKSKMPVSPFLYRYRNLVERFVNKRKHFRAVAIRYGKRDDNFLDSVQLASIRRRLRHGEPVIQKCKPSGQAWGGGRF